MREAKNESGRGGAQGGGRGYGRGRGGGGRSNRDSLTDENTVGNNHGFSGAYRPAEDGRDTGKPSDRRAGYGSPRTSRGGRRGGFGGFSNEGAEDVEYPRRIHERHSGTGRGFVFFVYYLWCYIICHCTISLQIVLYILDDSVQR